MGPFTSGKVDWSGDNPGIYLRNEPEGPWVALALFFRVVTSPYGGGLVALVLGEPTQAAGFPEAPNFCISDNEPLSEYLVRDFVSVFPTFQGASALNSMARLVLKGAHTESDRDARHSEFVTAPGIELELTWEGLGEAVAADISPERSSTKRHRMYSVFRAARTGKIAVNGRRLPGFSVDRDFHGRPMTSALLAFSESWIRQ
jgi:hypothetical protein